MMFWLHTYLLAKTAGEAAKDTAEETRRLISEITTWKIGQALIAIVLAYFSVIFLEAIINWLSERVRREWRLTIKQSLPFWRTIVLSFTAFFLSNLFLNLSRSNVLALTGSVAVALGFAFKDYVSSVIAGLLALFEAPYRVGDRVRIKDYYGEVVGYGLRGIRLQTPDDNIVTIPHNTIWTEAVSNANSGNLEAQVVTKFYLSSEVDPTLVSEILYRVAYTSKYTQLKLPVVVIIEEKPWGTEFRLKCYPMDARDEFIYQTDLIKRAKRIFSRHQFAYPKMPISESVTLES